MVRDNGMGLVVTRDVSLFAKLVVFCFLNTHKTLIFAARLRFLCYILVISTK